MLAHVIVGRVIEHVVGMAGTQEIKEVQPALRRAGAEPGEPVIADLSAETVLAGVARASVVDRDKWRGLQPGAQNVLCFADEIHVFVGQQALELTLRDRYANSSATSRGNVDCP